MAKVYNPKERLELEYFINMIAESTLQNNLCLYLGAGTSIQYGAMNWSDLIRKVYPSNKTWSNNEKAQYAELKGIDIKEEISKIISLIRVDSTTEETYLNYMLSFDYQSLWTTNYDNIIEQILDKKGKSFKPIYRYSHFRNLSYPGGYFLFKINGSFEAPETIVITQEDFIDYRKTHEAYLILLKRELLCKNFLFLGCSFDDDILKIAIKDIINCIDNSSENYTANHYAIIAEKNNDKLDFICKNLSKHYNINCMRINNPQFSYSVTYGISCRVKYNSIFVSGAKKFDRYSDEENIGKNVCQCLVRSFLEIEDFPFKFISGMGMSIGHFISGSVKQFCKGKNLNRYLQMEPFPFTNSIDNDIHRRQMIDKAGIFIFLYGDPCEDVTHSGMWKEYIYAKENAKNILVPLPCGKDSISYHIYMNELNDMTSFSYRHKDILSSFNYIEEKMEFYQIIVSKIILDTRERMDNIIDEIIKVL